MAARTLDQSTVPAKRAALIAAPVVLLITTTLTYRGLASVLEPRLAYLLGFLFYWIGWCFLFPLWVVGWSGLRRMFVDRRPRFTQRAWIGLACLIVPLLLAYGYEFPRAVQQANLPIVLLSAVISVVNGAAEEVLWRGTYSQVFPEDRLLGWLYPSLGFAVWHIAPQTVFPNTRPGGMISLVVTALVIGLMWGWISLRTRSIRWATLSHILFDFSGLGARIYLL